MEYLRKIWYWIWENTAFRNHQCASNSFWNPCGFTLSTR